MSYLLFMDESGHDHKQMPYEMRGGIALRAERVWSFALAMRDLELREFGVHLHDYDSEIKGEKLLNRDRFKWAVQTNSKTGQPYIFTDDTRRFLAKAFIERGRENSERLRNGSPAVAPTRLEMTAYGEASLRMADGIFDLLFTEGARLFISAIPRGAKKRPAGPSPEYLRKDLVYLLERYDYLLKDEVETGLMVMDQVEKTNDRRFGRTIANYFLKTGKGRERAKRLVPVPLFVTQDLSYALQAADVCLYAANWGCRFVPEMTGAMRPEIQARYESSLRRLRFSTVVYEENSQFRTYGFVYVPE